MGERSRTLEVLGAPREVLDEAHPGALDADGAVHLLTCQWSPGTDEVTLAELLDAVECPDCRAAQTLSATRSSLAVAGAALSGAAAAADETVPTEIAWCRDTLRRVEAEEEQVRSHIGQSAALEGTVEQVLQLLQGRKEVLRRQLRGLAEQVRKECARLRRVDDDHTRPLTLLGITRWEGSHNQLLNLAFEAYAEEGNGRGTLVMAVPWSVREWVLSAMHPRIGQSHRGPLIPPEADPDVVLEIFKTVWVPESGETLGDVTEAGQAALLLA